MSVTGHHEPANGGEPITVGVLTVSDTRSAADDLNGKYLRSAIEGAGHVVCGYHVVPDDVARVAAALDDLAGSARLVVINGGTGISPRDNTFDAVSAKFDKTLPGFGELFRMLSYEQVGPAAMLSRAVAGLYRGVFVFSVPGSPAAVQLAWEKLIQPELRHLIREISKQH